MPYEPYIIFGIVYETGTTTGSASNNVIITNETSNEQISVITNSLGQYVADLSNFLNGYTDGDFIKITATGGANNGKLLIFKTICFRDQAQIENLDIKYEI